MPVVEGVVDFLLDMLEVAHHAVGVELTGGAIDGDDPVVPVRVGALALIRKVEPVRTGDFHAFYDVVH